MVSLPTFSMSSLLQDSWSAAGSCERSDSDQREFDNSFHGSGEPSDRGEGDDTDVTRTREDKFDSPPKDKVYYRCDKCSYQTQIQYLLDRHVAKHQLDQPFQCSSCDYSDYDHSTFVDHWLEHQQAKIIPCPFCLYKCNHPASLKVHMLKHRTVEMLDCAMCEFSSNYVHSMKNHFEAFHTKTYSCEHCCEIMTKHELIGHNEKVHSVKTSQEPQKDDSSPESRLKVVKSGRGASDQKSDPRPSSRELPEPISSSQEVPGQRSSFRELLERSSSSRESSDRRSSSQDLHERRSFSRELPGSKEATKECPFCNFSSNSISNLESHIEKMHTTKYSCEMCSDFMTKHELISHYQEVHRVTLGPKWPRFRKVSGKALTGNASRNEARLKHFAEGARGFKCSVCKYTSRRMKTLETHKERFHKKTYPCPVCNLVMTRHALIKHSKKNHGVIIGSRGRLASRMEQQQQPKKLLVSEKSEIHVADDSSSGTGSRRVTTGTRRPSTAADKSAFKCQSCRFSADSVNSLKKHKMDIHTIKYKCKYCPIVNTKYGLIKHSKAKHGILLTANVRNAFRKLRPCKFLKITNEASDSNRSLQTKNTGRKNVINPGLSAKDRPPGVLKNEFSCAICLFSTHCKRSLEAHDYSFHAKIVKCNLCSATMTKYSLMMHSKQKHGVLMKSRGKASYLNKLMARLECSPSSDRNTDVGHRSLIEDPQLGVNTAADSLIDDQQPGINRAANSVIQDPQSDQDAPKDRHDCTICSFSSLFAHDISRHMVALHTENFPCKLCSTIMTAYELEEHSREVHGITSKRGWKKPDYSSPVAKMTRPTQERAENNRLAASRASLLRINLNDNESSSSSSDEKDNVRAILSSEYSNLAGTDSLKSCPKDSESSGLEPHTKVCPLCDYCTMKEDLLKRHMAKHELLECPVCNIPIIDNRRLPMHLKEHNPPETPFKCTFCNHVSRTAWNLYYHLAIHISALKIFDCPECDFSDTRRDVLQNHVHRKHKGFRSPKKNKSTPPHVGHSSGPTKMEMGPKSHCTDLPRIMGSSSQVVRRILDTPDNKHTTSELSEANMNACKTVPVNDGSVVKLDTSSSLPAEETEAELNLESCVGSNQVVRRILDTLDTGKTTSGSSEVDMNTCETEPVEGSVVKLDISSPLSAEETEAELNPVSFLGFNLPLVSPGVPDEDIATKSNDSNGTSGKKMKMSSSMPTLSNDSIEVCGLVNMAHSVVTDSTCQIKESEMMKAFQKNVSSGIEPDFKPFLTSTPNFGLVKPDKSQQLLKKRSLSSVQPGASSDYQIVSTSASSFNSGSSNFCPGLNSRMVKSTGFMANSSMTLGVIRSSAVSDLVSFLSQNLGTSGGAEIPTTGSDAGFSVKVPVPLAPSGSASMLQFREGISGIGGSASCRDSSVEFSLASAGHSPLPAHSRFTSCGRSPGSIASQGVGAGHDSRTALAAAYGPSITAPAAPPNMQAPGGINSPESFWRDQQASGGFYDPSLMLRSLLNQTYPLPHIRFGNPSLTQVSSSGDWGVGSSFVSNFPPMNAPSGQPPSSSGSMDFSRPSVTTLKRAPLNLTFKQHAAPHLRSDAAEDLITEGIPSEPTEQ